jgi:hypothetical protein
MRKQAGASKMHQPIALVRVARPKNQREHQPGPPGDLGRTVEMNFMAEGFAPQAEDMEKAGGNKAEARKHSFCRMVGAQGLMTEKDYKAKNFEPYGIDPKFIFDYEAEEKLAMQEAEIAKLKKELEMLKKGGEK